MKSYGYPSGSPLNVSAARYESHTPGAITPTTSEVANQVHRLHGNATNLHEAIAKIEERLTGVLRPVPPATTGDGRPGLDVPNGPPMAPLAVELAELAHRVAVAENRLYAILERVEL